MPPIPSPYNFVPAADFIVTPDWAEQVSHDVPFKDGISGWFDIEVEAKSPIYVRSGGQHPEKEKRNEDPSYREFFQVLPGEQFAIPGTSLRGVIRNVLEIASFSKLSRMQDNRFAVRDLTLAGYKSAFTASRNGGFEPLAQAGWLREVGDTWTLTPCEFARVERQDLEGFAGRNGKRVDLKTTARGEDAEAADKYKAWNAAGLPPELICDVGPKEPQHERHPRVPLVYRLATAPRLTSGGTLSSKSGRVVFTGQCGGKHMEFFFYPPPANGTDASYPVPNGVREKFEHCSYSGDSEATWKVWRSRMRKGEPVPVFYLGSPSEPSSMGLALMYRLPAPKSLRECLPAGHRSSARDLAELVFGHVPDGKDKRRALRGRVQFETLLGPNLAEVQNRPGCVQTVLGGPKPSFHPNYLQQEIVGPNGDVKLKNGKPDYSTFLSPSPKIRGWKRYSAWPADQASQSPPVAPSDAVATRFHPLPQGTCFTGRVHVHNLRPEELGALLWTLTWGELYAPEPRYRHRVGMAKSLGYGSVTIRLSQAAGAASLRAVQGTEVELAKCIDAFTAWMDKQVAGKLSPTRAWLKTDQLAELQAMADSTKTLPTNLLKAPKLDLDRQNGDDFRNYKKEGLALLPYSNYVQNHGGGATIPRAVLPASSGADTTRGAGTLAATPEPKSTGASISAGWREGTVRGRTGDGFSVDVGESKHGLLRKQDVSGTGPLGLGSKVKVRLLPERGGDGSALLTMKPVPVVT